MYTSSAILFLAAAGAATASVLNERAPYGALDARSISQGWSLAASSAPDGTTSCGGGAYCPSSLKCNPAGNAQVAACCTSSDCRGEVQGAPVCADSSWSLWKGRDGNGFCCIVGEIGSYDSKAVVAGTCGGAVAAGATSAVLMTTGSGSAPATQTSSPTSATAESPAASVTSAASSAASAASSAASSSSSVVSSAATSAAAASSSAASAANSTASASTPRPSSGAERVVGGFAFAVLAVGAAALAL